MDKETPIGQRLKRYRLLNDIRQEDVAEKLGISRATLINYEKGHTNISVEILERFKQFYPDFETEFAKFEDVTKPPIIQDNVIDFGILFKVLLAGKSHIIFSALILSLLGALGSYLFPKYYTAHVSLYPAKKENIGLGQLQSLASNFGMNMPTNEQDFNIPDVVQSRMIADKVLNRKWEKITREEVNLISLWELNKNPWYSLKKSEPADTAFIAEKAVSMLWEQLNVVEDRRTGLIEIKVALEDPLIAAAVANFIGEEVQNYIQKENSAQAAKEKVFIMDRLSIVKSELEALELKLKEFKNRNRGYEDSPELFMVFSRVFREVEAKQQVYVTLQQQLELARIEEVKKTPIVHILDKAVPPARKSSPKRLMMMFLSGVFGFVAASLVTLFKY